MNGPTRSLAMKADVLVIFNGPENTCEVVLGGGAPTSLLFTDVVGYLVNDLKLPTGTLFDITTVPDVKIREYEYVLAALKAAGYRLTPGIHVGFLTEPKRHDR